MASKKPNSELLVGIDIGTSKVATLVADLTPEGKLNVIGFGSRPSQGLKKGVVVNIDATVQAIQRSVEEAELMAGCEIFSAFTGIAGSHIRSMNSHGVVAIRNQEVTQQDVERVIEAAKAVSVPSDQKVLHVLPQEYLIDQQDSIYEPIGMSGVRLEARVHIVTGAVSAAQNIVKCIQRCGLTVNDIVLEQVASSYATLLPDEKNRGICLIDIGRGTSDIAIFARGAIRHTTVIPIAGDQVTNDIAYALCTPTTEAESIKINYGCADKTLVEGSQTIEVSAAGYAHGKQFPQRELVKVIEARYEELFSLILKEIDSSGLRDVIAAGAGILLTGGAAKMVGAVELARKVFNMTVRLGVPSQIIGLPEIVNNPIYATGAGLLVYGSQQRANQQGILLNHSGIKGVWARMRDWFQGNF